MCIKTMQAGWPTRIPPGWSTGPADGPVSLAGRCPARRDARPRRNARASDACYDEARRPSRSPSGAGHPVPLSCTAPDARNDTGSLDHRLVARGIDRPSVAARIRCTRTAVTTVVGSAEHVATPRTGMSASSGRSVTQRRSEDARGGAAIVPLRACGPRRGRPERAEARVCRPGTGPDNARSTLGTAIARTGSAGMAGRPRAESRRARPRRATPR